MPGLKSGFRTHSGAIGAVPNGGLCGLNLWPGDSCFNALGMAKLTTHHRAALSPMLGLVDAGHVDWHQIMTLPRR